MPAPTWSGPTSRARSTARPRPRGASRARSAWTLISRGWSNLRRGPRGTAPLQPSCLHRLQATSTGNGNPAHVSTSYLERQNLTMPRGMRRFTRLTNGFSKKIETHEAAIALYVMRYNFRASTRPCA